MMVQCWRCLCYPLVQRQQRKWQWTYSETDFKQKVKEYHLKTRIYSLTSLQMTMLQSFQLFVLGQKNGWGSHEEIKKIKRLMVALHCLYIYILHLTVINNLNVNHNSSITFWLRLLKKNNNMPLKPLTGRVDLFMYSSYLYIRLNSATLKTIIIISYKKLNSLYITRLHF